MTVKKNIYIAVKWPSQNTTIKNSIKHLRKYLDEIETVIFDLQDFGDLKSLENFKLEHPDVTCILKCFDLRMALLALEAGADIISLNLTAIESEEYNEINSLANSPDRYTNPAKILQRIGCITDNNFSTKSKVSNSKEVMQQYEKQTEYIEKLKDCSKEELLKQLCAKCNEKGVYLEVVASSVITLKKSIIESYHNNSYEYVMMNDITNQVKKVTVAGLDSKLIIVGVESSLKEIKDAFQIIFKYEKYNLGTTYHLELKREFAYSAGVTFLSKKDDYRKEIRKYVKNLNLNKLFLTTNLVKNFGRQQDFHKRIL